MALRRAHQQLGQLTTKDITEDNRPDLQQPVRGVTQPLGYKSVDAEPEGHLTPQR